MTGTTADGAAEQTALRLAARYDLTLTGLHVIVPDTLPPETLGDPGVGTPLDPTLMQFNDETLELQRHAQQALLAAFSARCAAAGVRSVARGETGTAAEAIVHAALEENAVWLSREGLHPGRTVWNSTFEAVVRHSPVPVWVCADQAQIPERIVIAYDAQRRARDALAVATTLSLEWSLPLEVLIASSEDTGFQEVIQNARLELTAHGVPAALVNTAHGDPGAVLVGATAPGTLLVMGTHSQGTFLGFRRGHTVDTVLLGASGHILLCP